MQRTWAVVRQTERGDGPNPREYLGTVIRESAYEAAEEFAEGQTFDAQRLRQSPDGLEAFEFTRYDGELRRTELLVLQVDGALA